MKKEGYYSSGEFAKTANITKKTLRYYDEKNILKPSFVTDSGARFYTDMDLLHLQQILLLKFLGFSLNDIREMLVNGGDTQQMTGFLQIQKKLVEDKIGELELVKKTINDASGTLENGGSIDWERMLELIRITGMEDSMRNQYRNASNISARIRLHALYSENKTGWFNWIYEELGIRSGMKVLEIGCGDGALWKGHTVPENVSVTLTDISDGMVRDAAGNLTEHPEFKFETADCEVLPFADDSFDLVIANHVLFYCRDMEKGMTEISRVLKKGGRMVAGTYGKNHMKEVSTLVQAFDERIALNAGNLYDRFGRENGGEILKPYFKTVEWKRYEDCLCVTEAEPLISYVLSCHGNQNRYIVDSYSEFKAFVLKKTQNGFHITKDAGIFIAEK